MTAGVLRPLPGVSGWFRSVTSHRLTSIYRKIGRKDFQPNRNNRNAFSLVQQNTFRLTSETVSLRYYTPSELPISHSRRKFSASETTAQGSVGKLVTGRRRLSWIPGVKPQRNRTPKNPTSRRQAHMHTWIKNKCHSLG